MTGGRGPFVRDQNPEAPDDKAPDDNLKDDAKKKSLPQAVGFYADGKIINSIYIILFIGGGLFFYNLGRMLFDIHKSCTGRTWTDGQLCFVNNDFTAKSQSHTVRIKIC